MNLTSFVQHDLGDENAFYEGHLPEELTWSDARFQQAWDLHPEVKPTIFLHGREVMIPRWQQAYGQNYRFSGQVSSALPIPELLQPLLTWSQENIHPGLNGLLLNWYEGPGHYIGPHHDSVVDMAEDAPIVTISFGETRKFRLSLGTEKRDFLPRNGTVYVLPRATNAIWKHSVPKSTRYSGRRISVTIRGFLAESEND
jgi:alkylated DNA repair dioxygenase AlkB